MWQSWPLQNDVIGKRSCYNCRLTVSNWIIVKNNIHTSGQKAKANIPAITSKTTMIIMTIIYWKSNKDEYLMEVIITKWVLRKWMECKMCIYLKDIIIIDVHLHVRHNNHCLLTSHLLHNLSVDVFPDNSVHSKDIISLVKSE